MQVRDTWRITRRVNCRSTHLEDKQVKQIQLYTIIKKSRAMEKKEKLPAAFRKVGHRTFKEHHAPQSPLGLSRPAWLSTALALRGGRKPQR